MLATGEALGALENPLTGPDLPTSPTREGCSLAEGKMLVCAL